MHYPKTKEELNFLISSYNKVVIDYSAVWCGPCKQISPYFSELEKDYHDVAFVKIDIDECSALADEYNIASVPTFHFFKGGVLVEEVVGADKAKLEKMIHGN